LSLRGSPAPANAFGDAAIRHQFNTLHANLIADPDLPLDLPLFQPG
jgi:hypothetical protein